MITGRTGSIDLDTMDGLLRQVAARMLWDAMSVAAFWLLAMEHPGEDRDPWGPIGGDISCPRCGTLRPQHYRYPCPSCGNTWGDR